MGAVCSSTRSLNPRSRNVKEKPATMTVGIYPKHFIGGPKPMQIITLMELSPLLASSVIAGVWCAGFCTLQMFRTDVRISRDMEDTITWQAKHGNDIRLSERITGTRHPSEIYRAKCEKEEADFLASKSN